MIIQSTTKLEHPGFLLTLPDIAALLGLSAYKAEALVAARQLLAPHPISYRPAVQLSAALKEWPEDVAQILASRQRRPQPWSGSVTLRIAAQSYVGATPLDRERCRIAGIRTCSTGYYACDVEQPFYTCRLNTWLISNAIQESRLAGFEADAARLEDIYRMHLIEDCPFAEPQQDDMKKVLDSFCLTLNVLREEPPRVFATLPANMIPLLSLEERQ